MARLLPVRHGESVWTSKRRIQGGLDPALSPRGRRPTGRVVGHLGASISRAGAAITASPLRRAAQTAEPVAKAYRLPGVHDPDLCEMGLGTWEGKTVEEIRASTPGPL